MRNRWLVVGLFVFLYIPFVWGSTVRSAANQSVDLPSFYWASVVVFDEGASPYGADSFTAHERAFGQRIFPFLYSPASLLLFYPYSLVSYEMAKSLTLWVNQALILFLALFLVFYVFRDRWEWSSFFPFLLIIYVFHFHPLEVNLFHGQVNLFVLAAICLLWYALKRPAPGLGAEIPAGLALAGAIVLKTYPVVLIGLLLVKSRYRMAAVSVGGVALLWLVSGFVLPSGVHADWWRDIVPAGGYGRTPLGLFPPAGPWNQSLNAFTARLFTENPFSQPLLPNEWAGRVSPYLLGLLIAAPAIWLLLRARSHPPRPALVDLEMSLVLCVLFLLAPFSWEHHLVFLLPAALVALSTAFQDRERPVRWRAAGLIGALLIAWSIPFTSAGLQQGLPTLLISVKFFGVLLLFVSLASGLHRALDPGRREASRAAFTERAPRPEAAR